MKKSIVIGLLLAVSLTAFIITTSAVALFSKPTPTKHSPSVNVTTNNNSTSNVNATGSQQVSNGTATSKISVSECKSLIRPITQNGKLAGVELPACMNSLNITQLGGIILPSSAKVNSTSNTNSSSNSTIMTAPGPTAHVCPNGSVADINATCVTAKENSTVITEATAMSSTDALIGHQAHQAVVVLPLRSDGKLWDGTVSWTASKPVELRLLYDYNSSLTTDANHGRPVTAPLALSTESPHIPLGEVAIALIKPFNGPPIVSSFDSGSMPFIAKAVAFHTVNGDKFTVTYAVKATAEKMNK